MVPRDVPSALFLFDTYTSKSLVWKQVEAKQAEVEAPETLPHPPGLPSCSFRASDHAYLLDSSPEGPQHSRRSPTIPLHPRHGGLRGTQRDGNKESRMLKPQQGPFQSCIFLKGPVDLDQSLETHPRNAGIAQLKQIN